MPLRRTLLLLTFYLMLSCVNLCRAEIVIDFSTDAPFQGPIYTQHDVTVTGPNDVVLTHDVLTGNAVLGIFDTVGLENGVEGGFAALPFIPPEFVDFTFNVAAGDVVYSLEIAAKTSSVPGEAGIRLVEGFGLDGNSLGVFQQSGVTGPGTFGAFPVSELFGNAPLSRFRLTPLIDHGFSVRSIAYNTVTAVPEPNSILAIGLSIAWAAFRRRKST